MTARRTLLAVLLSGAALAAYAAYVMLQPYRGYPGETFVEVHRGAGTFEISAQLRQGGVLRAEWPFLLLRLVRSRSVLKAGEYRFDRPLSPLQVYRKITLGDSFYYPVTIPEGYNMFEIAEAVARTGVMTRQEFLLEAERGERLAAIAPGARTLEGFLFPDTYRLTRQGTAEDLVSQMLKRFREVFQPLQVALPAPGRSVLDTVTLASLVEKETPAPAERPLVASVFLNRLRIGMPLQCDPTVLYALQAAGRPSGEIYKDHLSFQSPYNTYVRPGLPPGPIANPGRASLQAALAPASSGYFYFVADNEGGHVFSATLDRHSKAVASFRRANGRRPSNKDVARP